jgi:hypothetical protein
MIDLYLKASSVMELYAYLELAGVTVRSEDGHGTADGHKYALDVIGEIPDKVGYHANLRVIDASNFDAGMLASITIDAPSNPVRGWA